MVQMAACASCGAETGGRPFCGRCGAPAGSATALVGGEFQAGGTCPNGHPVAADTRFCSACGAAVTALATSAAVGATAPASVVMASAPSPTGLIHSPAPMPPRPRLPPWAWAAMILVVALGVGGVALIGGSWADHSPPTAATATAPTAAQPTTPAAPTPTIAPVTTPTIAPATAPTSAPLQVTAEMHSWPSDPNKCGPPPPDNGQPFSADRSYEVTATIHLWSQPTTASTPLAVITSNAPGGGEGCSTDVGPFVTVSCEIVDGQPIEGPFSIGDPIWDQITWQGQTGWVPDEWVNTQYDANDGNIPRC